MLSWLQPNMRWGRGYQESSKSGGSPSQHRVHFGVAAIIAGWGTKGGFKGGFKVFLDHDTMSTLVFFFLKAMAIRIKELLQLF